VTGKWAEAEARSAHSRYTPLPKAQEEEKAQIFREGFQRWLSLPGAKSGVLRREAEARGSGGGGFRN